MPPLTGRVVDQTGDAVGGDHRRRLTQTLKDVRDRKGSQVAVLIVPTTEPETIEQFSIRVAEAWKIGRKKVDDGAILVVAKNDRQLRIEVGYGLEGALTDVTSKRIIDEDITPKFRSGDFAGGIRRRRPHDARDRRRAAADALAQLITRFETSSRFLILPLFGVRCSSAAILRSCSGGCSVRGITGAIVGVLAWFVIGSGLVIGLGVGVLRRRPDVYCRSVWRRDRARGPRVAARGRAARHPAAGAAGRHRAAASAAAAAVLAAAVLRGAGRS